MQDLTNEMRYCVKYLVDRDVGPEEFAQIAGRLKYFHKEYKLVESKSDFFFEVASKLWSMWPKGKKGGQWEWRDSVSNLARRLELLWQIRSIEGDITVDDCVAAAQIYLNKFRSDTTYMRILKYFILRQSKQDERGKRITVNDSPFADILITEWLEIRRERELKKQAESLLNEASGYYTGELI